MATYRSVTISSTVDKNLDNMGYKFWVPLQVTSSAGFVTQVSLAEKYCPHFKTEEEARKYLDYAKDKNASQDGTAVWTSVQNIADA